MKEALKRNWIFILFVIIGVICFIKKDNVLPMEIVSQTDAYIEFSKNDEKLEQTWLSEVKEICGVSFNVGSKENIDAQMTLNVLDAKTRELLAASSKKIVIEKGREQEISFSFDKIKDCLGKQFIFQLCFDETTGENIILIPSGTNYAGCTINGKEIRQGAAFNVLFVKNSRLFWLFCSFFPFISFSFLFMVIWNKKWEECIGLSTAMFIFLIFFMGLFNKLTQGITLAYILSIMAFVGGLILYNKKKMRLTDLSSWGAIIYGIMVLLILINCNGARYARWDEFSHWGLAVKDMFYSNSFAKHFGSAVMMKYYPPVATLIEYFFCYTNKLFSEGMTYVGFQILSLNLLSSGWGICKNRKPIVLIPVSLSLLFVPIVFFQDVYNCLYADPILAFGVAYVLICYYTDKWDKYNFLRILGGLFILTLTKDSGVVLAGLLTLIMLGTSLYQQYIKKSFDIKRVGVHLLCTAWVCILFFGWQYYLSIPIEKNAENVITISESDNNIEKNESTTVTGAITQSGITLEGIIELCTGNAPAYRHTAIKKFVTKVFSENFYSFGMISFAYMDLLILLVLFLLFCAEKGMNREEKSSIRALGILMFIAGVGYAGFLLITYLFAFSVSEAVTMASLARYLASYICGVMIAFLIILVMKTEFWLKRTENRILWIITTIVLIITPVEYFIIKNEDTELTDEYVYGYDDLTDILQSTAKSSDNIYFVCNNTNGCAELQFKTSVVPLITEYMTANIFASKEQYLKQMDIYATEDIKSEGTPYIVTTSEWSEMLSDYQYVVLFSVNDVFKESYESLFSEPETIGDGVVYKVCSENGRVNIEFIGKTGVKMFK